MSVWNTSTLDDELPARDDAPGLFIAGRSHAMRPYARVAHLESRVVHGPVVYLVGGRLTASRPTPRTTRRIDTPAGAECVECAA